MKILKRVLLFICIIFLFGCKNKKIIDNDSSKSAAGKTVGNVEDDLIYIKKDGANHKSFFYDGRYNGRFYTDERSEYFELPELNNYENFRIITVAGAETLNLSRLSLYQTNDLDIHDCNLNKIIFDSDCKNIKQLTIYDCEFNTPDFLSHFPNVMDIMLGCKIECIPDLSNNRNLRGIWIFPETYEDNKDMYEKIQQKYPDIIVEAMMSGEL